MARIGDDEQAAAAFRAARHVPSVVDVRAASAVAGFGAAGLARMRAAAATETGPVIDCLDLLVLR
ncbi:MAG TPA: hypothetical protein VF869_01360 [Jatrophihabitantaceae bacterium]